MFGISSRYVVVVDLMEAIGCWELGIIPGRFRNRPVTLEPGYPTTPSIRSLLAPLSKWLNSVIVTGVGVGSLRGIDSTEFFSNPKAMIVTCMCALKSHFFANIILVLHVS